MITLNEALHSYDDHVRLRPLESIPLADAHRRVLARPPQAAIDLPRYDASAMDGYALRAADAAMAGGNLPVTDVAAPGQPRIDLPRNAAVRIYTGAPVPTEADTVVPQEQVQRRGNTIAIREKRAPGANVRRQAEELSAGAILADAGDTVTPGLLAALAMAGVASVTVPARPAIAVLITGDEVQPAGTGLEAGEIADANGPLITACLSAWGLEAPAPVYVGDHRESTEAALSRALSEADLVLTSGGASVGDHDFVPEAAEAVGVTPVLRKVAQKPGKPIFFGMRGETAMLALPGNPAAVLVGMLVHARRIIDRMSGQARPGPDWYSGRLTEELAPDSRRDRLVRMRASLDDSGRVSLAQLAGQASHMLGNLARANALAYIPAGPNKLPADTPVAWIPLPGTGLLTDPDQH